MHFQAPVRHEGKGFLESAFRRKIDAVPFALVAHRNRRSKGGRNLLPSVLHNGDRAATFVDMQKPSP